MKADIHSQQTRHLDKPAHVIRVDFVFDSPPCQVIPLIPGTAIDGQTQLDILIFTFLKILHHLLKCKAGDEEIIYTVYKVTKY